MQVVNCLLHLNCLLVLLQGCCACLFSFWLIDALLTQSTKKMMKNMKQKEEEVEVIPEFNQSTRVYQLKDVFTRVDQLKYDVEVFEGIHDLIRVNEEKK